jgi:hypothetical protein
MTHGSLWWLTEQGCNLLPQLLEASVLDRRR